MSLLCYSKLSVRADFCVDIAKIRRLIRRVPKKRLLILDETHCRVNIVPTRTLVLPGESPEVEVVDTDKYAHRIDMFACVHISGVLPVQTYTTAERQQLDVKGLNADMFYNYITTVLGPAVFELTEPSYVLVLDKAPIHKSHKRIIDAFAECGVVIERVIYYPTAGAKRLSPLDNCLFHVWKDGVRDRCPVSEDDLPSVMIEEWNSLTRDQIKAQYQHCGYYNDRNLYFDCPKPTVHIHEE